VIAMTTVALTPELRQAVEEAGAQPVRLEDPESHRTYVLLDEDDSHRLRSPGQTKQAPFPGIPEGILRSQDAFFHDLAELLNDESLRGQRIAYHGDERIGIAPRAEPLIRECVRRGLREDQYDLFVIEPQSREIEKIEIVTPLFDIPEGVRRSQRAFLRDLPQLLKDESLRGKWVAYHGDERIGIASTEESLLQECLRRGLKKDQYDTFIIDDTEEVIIPSSWM
jgi:hypothetical protein